MKSIRLLFVLVLIIVGISGFSQAVTLQVSGQVTDQQTALPVANHMVAVTVYPDSINFFVPFTDSTLTDQAGTYSIDLAVPYTAGTATFLSAGTFDCTMSWLQQTFVYSGSQSAFTADFAICTDSIPPPSPCENYIIPASIQGLTVSLQGALMNGMQAASYFWELGDGTSSTGQYITHTYAQQGVYTVTLQTVTSDSCADFSDYMLVLMDSINPPSPCENYISVIGVQGLYLSFEGNMLYGQQASYTWDFGDGSSGSGQFADHTYSQPGIYSVVLQTVTNDSCIYSSVLPLVLMDSIPGGCAGYFIATPSGNPLEMSFEGYIQNNYPAEFTWQFGEGATATGQNVVHAFCCAGTYMVTLTTTDSTGCSSTYTAPVVVLADSLGNMVLGGQVFAGNSYLNQGIVTLFSTDPAGSYYPVQTAYIDSAGYYTFWNVSTGTYLILAYPQPDSLSGSQYLPTYYGDVIFWEQATPIYLGIPLNPYNINLVSYDSIGGGDGSISGQLTGGGKSMLTGGQEVLLLDAYGIPVRIAYTDPQGYFTFASLPFNEYQVNPVLTGLTTLPATVILDATSPSATVYMTIEGNTITGITERQKAGMIETIYPNPATDQISVAVKVQGKVELRILDASGRMVWVNNETISSVGTLLTIPVSDFKPGIYFLLIRDENGNTSSGRFVKN